MKPYRLCTEADCIDAYPRALERFGGEPTRLHMHSSDFGIKPRQFARVNTVELGYVLADAVTLTLFSERTGACYTSLRMNINPKPML